MGGIVVLLNYSVGECIDRLPILGEALPLCECPTSNLRPYRTHKSIGICCTVCNSASWTRFKKNDNDSFIKLLCETDGSLFLN